MEETTIQRKRRINNKIERARSACLRWRLVKENHPLTLQKVERDMEELKTKKSKLLQELEIAGVEHDKAKAQLARWQGEQTKDFVQPKVQRAAKLLSKLKDLAADLEDMDLTPEQLDMIKKARQILTN